MTNERKDSNLQEQDTMTATNRDPAVKSIFDRLVRLHTERHENAEMIKEVFAEARSKGHLVDGLRAEVKEHMLTDKQISKRERVEEERQVVKAALGEFADSGLGAAALRAVG